MPRITIENIVLNISEDRLVGILCATINMFNLKPPYDIEFETTSGLKPIENNGGKILEQYLKFKGTTTLKESINNVHKLCTELMKPPIGHIDCEDECF